MDEESTSFMGWSINLDFPHGRFLAGWTLGDTGLCSVEKYVFDSLELAESYASNLMREEARRKLLDEEKKLTKELGKSTKLIWKRMHKIRINQLIQDWLILEN